MTNLKLVSFNKAIDNVIKIKISTQNFVQLIYTIVKKIEGIPWSSVLKISEGSKIVEELSEYQKWDCYRIACRESKSYQKILNDFIYFNQQQRNKQGV